MKILRRVIKLQVLFQVPDKDSRIRAKLLRLSTQPTNNKQDFSESSRSKTQYLPNQTLNFDNILKVYDFDILKQFLEKKVKQFKASSIRFCFEKWKLITSDPEVPQTV